MAVGVVLLVGAAWLVVTGLLARSQLETARAEVHTLRAQIGAGDLAGARASAHSLARHAARAHSLTTGPAWAIAAAVPWAGTPLDTVRGVTAGIDDIGQHALPQLISASARLDPSTLRRPDGSVDVAAVRAVLPGLDSASTTLSRATRAVRELPGDTWLGAVDHARASLLSQLSGLAETVHSANLAARILPPMLGADGPRSYLMTFENEAELRGTGGLPGAFAIVRADHGRLSFTHFGTDGELVGTPSGLSFGAQFAQLYDAPDVTSDYRDSNVSANFPYAARIWLAMWERKSGERLDGAIAMDPTALSYLLAVTGPATLPDGSQITAGNVVERTQRTVYARYGTLVAKVQRERKRYLLQIARSVSETILGTPGKTTELVKAAGKAAGQRRLLVYSDHPDTQRLLAQTPVAGVVPKTSAPFVGLTLNNAAGNKIDYYVHAGLRWHRTGCGPTRDVTVTLTLRNDAPADLPPYVLGLTALPSYPGDPGDTRLVVRYYATAGTQMDRVTVDGRPSTAAVGSERGHPVYLVVLDLPRGSTRTLGLHLSEPAGDGSPVVMPQPMVHPLSVRLTDADCR